MKSYQSEDILVIIINEINLTSMEGENLEGVEKKEIATTGEKNNDIPLTNGEKPILRDEKGKFLPGTATPSPGRPKGSISLLSMLKEWLEKQSRLVKKDGDKEIVLSNAEALIEKIFKKAIDDEDVTMIKDIMDRVDGRPQQSLDVKVDDHREDNPITDLLKKQNAEQRAKSIAVLTELLNQADEGSDLPNEPSNVDSEGSVPKETGDKGLETGATT